VVDCGGRLHGPFRDADAVALAVSISWSKIGYRTLVARRRRRDQGLVVCSCGGVSITPPANGKEEEMVLTSVQEVFEGLKRRTFEPRLRGVYGSYRFDILGVGSFRVSVSDGDLRVVESEGGGDCVITCGPGVFLRIVNGTQNLLTAAMQGLVEIGGDLALAQRLHALLPSPLEEHAGEQP